MTGVANSKRFGRQQSVRRPVVEKGRWAAKGTKPLQEQATMMHILSVMVIHICRKVLFIETKVKITLYFLGLFFGSLIFDFLPVPRTYMSMKTNIFNLYFVRIGWAWLLFVVGSFVYLTSVTYGCGKREVMHQHMTRLLIGTVVWGCMTQWIFVSVEAATGECLGKAILEDKWSCVTSGHQWHAFDISSHAFLLVYMNLVTVEEAQAIVGWEGIQAMIFKEQHRRKPVPAPTTTSAASAAPTGGSAVAGAIVHGGMETQIYSGAGTSGYSGAGTSGYNGAGTSVYSGAGTSGYGGAGTSGGSATAASGYAAASSANASVLQSDEEETSLGALTNTDFFTLKDCYESYTPYIRLLFVAMTCLSLICDVLLACTVIYFHTMPQKVVGGAIGIASWYITYRVVFKGQWPGLPGDGGLVRYKHAKEKNRDALPRKRSVVTTKDNQQVPMFMGMPLHGGVKKDDKGNKETPGDEPHEDRSRTGGSGHGGGGAHGGGGPSQGAPSDGGASCKCPGSGRRSRFPSGNVWR